VHPTAAGYRKLAAGVEAICLSIASGAKKQARSNSFETGDGPSSLHNREMTPEAATTGYQRGSSRGGAGAGSGGRGAKHWPNNIFTPSSDQRISLFLIVFVVFCSFSMCHFFIYFL
jgi:hypothetical protein